jgi:hypothetical protein
VVAYFQPEPKPIEERGRLLLPDARILEVDEDPVGREYEAFHGRSYQPGEALERLS